MLDRDPLGQGRLGPNPAGCDGAMQVSMVRRTVMDLSGEDEDDRAELCSKLREVRRIHDVLVEKVAASEAELRLLASQALLVGADPGLVEELSGLDVGLLAIEHFRRPGGVE